MKSPKAITVPQQADASSTAPERGGSGCEEVAVLLLLLLLVLVLLIVSVVVVVVLACDGGCCCCCSKRARYSCNKRAAGTGNFLGTDCFPSSKFYAREQLAQRTGIRRSTKQWSSPGLFAYPLLGLIRPMCLVQCTLELCGQYSESGQP
jgi:hypothetical protein